jgi:2-C-methyl-D-erythritol 4-phosphate cytidylyltransferase
LYKGFGPECAKLSTLLEIHTSPCAKNAIDTTTTGLAINIGKKVLAVRGNNRCFKITTAEDFELFKMYLSAEPLNNIIRRTKNVTFH